MYCGMPKGTCRAEPMSTSEKIKPVALAIIELYLSEGRQAGRRAGGRAGGQAGRQAGRQPLENSAKKKF